MSVPDGRISVEKVKAVQRLLGFVNYLAKFVPHLADECEPLRQLTDKDADWVWEKHHQDTFDHVKQLVADYPVLCYYDVNPPVIIQCNSSETGLGAALLQDSQPVAFVSRILTPMAQGCAQIEKEGLAIVFACERFNQYLFGRESVSVQSDHNSFNTKTFARSWKIGEVTPVLKSGDSEEPCNHRPISLLPVLSKVSERLAHRQFVDFLSANKKLAKTQSGNRKLHSTETALLCVTDDLLRAMDDK